MLNDKPTQSDLRGGRRRPAARVAGAFCIAAAILGGVLAFRAFWSTPAEELIAEARLALERGDSREAERIAGLCLKQQPASAEALLLAGKAAEMQGRREAALAYLESVDENGSPEAVESLSLRGRLLVQLGQAAAAEACLRRALEHAPDDFDSHQYLAFLLRLQGRNWEMRPHVFALLRASLPAAERRPHDQSFKTFIYLLRPVGNPEWVWLEPHEQEIVDLCRAKVPGDFLPALGKARMAAAANEIEPAGDVFRRIVAANPRQIEAQAQLGLLLANGESAAEFQQWAARLPPTAHEHPECWVARGIFARKLERREAAARCFWEALRLHPDHKAANYQLSQLLVSLGRAADAQPFAERADRLARLEYLIKEVGSESQRVPEIAATMESLGRTWEAAGWYRLGVEILPGDDSARDGLSRSVAGLVDNPPQTRAAANPANQLDLSSYPLPAGKEVGGSPRGESVASAGRHVAWTDLAEAAGLKFSYRNGARPGDDRAYMFEFGGGGIAVLDYDGDGWPDLYLTQGGEWPPQEEGSNDNRLYRNLGNGRFEEVTAQAQATGSDFSQGVTAGDFNNDGFPDLYVANIGANRFYENNGDGTFSDVTPATGTAGDAWSLSGALADLNGDGLPDLYVVNYLGGPDVFERICRKAGRAIQCDPTMFPAEQDQLYLNLGDGRFENVTGQSGIVARDGKGMGIVVADFRNSRLLDVFVANDTTANFLFVNQTPAPGDSPSFAEEGLLRGVALDENGQAQSSMGVAAGDATGDGLVDLFVTNFTREANNLFQQQQDGTFADAAQPNLYDSGFPLMGWGAQFLDADLDGRLDLVVANGDLEDLADVGVASRMPLVYYANAGNGRFAAPPAAQLGAYFQQRNLGRAIGTLDWNRDGLPDFCVSHVDAPVALMTNRTSTHGHFLAVTLRGVQSSRDAIGAVVRLNFGGQSLSQQLIAGDGFQASNQRQVIFGLGDAAAVDELTIAWPSGADETFENLSADQEVLAVEGRGQLYRLIASKPTAP